MWCEVRRRQRNAGNDPLIGAAALGVEEQRSQRCPSGDISRDAEVNEMRRSFGATLLQMRSAWFIAFYRRSARHLRRCSEDLPPTLELPHVSLTSSRLYFRCIWRRILDLCTCILILIIILLILIASGFIRYWVDIADLHEGLWSIEQFWRCRNILQF